MVARDFPGWLPPMLVKELRQGLRTRGFVSTLMGFQLVMLVLTLASLSSQNAVGASARMAGAAFTAFFWVVIAVQLLFVTPSRALGGLQQEIEARTLDLLVLTRLTAWRIVLGKWVSLLAQAALLLVAMTPYLVVRYFTDNADLVEDVKRCLVLLAVSAVLTAAGLWGSGVAKVARVLMSIVLGVFAFNVVGTLGSAFGGRFGGGPGPLGNVIQLPVDLFNGVLLTAFFLLSAVRNIAPLAENHCLFARLLPGLALILAPLLAAWGQPQLATRQLFVAAGFLALVLLVEMATSRQPMPTHWRDWYLRGRLSRAIGRLTLPGWPSAYLYGIVLSALWALAAYLILSAAASTPRGPSPEAARLALLGLAALTFPAVLQSFVRTRVVPRPLIYLAGLVSPALLAGAALWLADSRWKVTSFQTVMETMPVSSFLFGLSAADPLPFVHTAQVVVAVLVLAAAAWRSRAYWRNIAAFEERDRAARVKATPEP